MYDMSITYTGGAVVTLPFCYVYPLLFIVTSIVLWGRIWGNLLSKLQLPKWTLWTFFDELWNWTTVATPDFTGTGSLGSAVCNCRDVWTV